jgi:NAD-dependent dihydropyrimidine dehydrogenase PreA subunit
VARTRITIDSARCGDGVGVDPRECGLCLRICEPAVFVLHQTLDADEPDPYDPQMWRVTPLWPSLCTGCQACAAACPQQAIEVRSGRGRSGAGSASRSSGSAAGAGGAAG